MGKPSPLSLGPTRATLRSSTSCTSHHLFRSSGTPTTTASAAGSSQVRHATFIRRPRRPYTFTQLVQLSDGSSYTVRTTSPQPLYRSAKDSRNTLLWRPSEKSLRNVEVDEAGKLAAFRERFGRAFDQQQDAAAAAAASSDKDGGKHAGKQAAAAGEEEENDDGGYADLISAYAPDSAGQLKDAGAQPGKKK
ncbi:54S ribosomal protein-like protein [Hapsidospora chrysogenum ATCC 11550]|uniref:54S ribosomal protein-like protein n=1 Tax=Hapsidospora chrysogenum (strain ATCC 11550 / CBS 779.69 / DSM 880 / IAM 14645 / JCM 23072 / IMI 49137) TaxID=857340 RepID=A0A086SY11_HAPC1|nr:54S ribosomal protein-like protein [Hapsidospora chrysogenum ATCC 11550]